MCSLKQVLLKISQKLQENNCAEVSFNKAADPQQIFYRRLLQQLVRTFNSDWSSTKYSENVYISVKAKSKHQVTYSVCENPYKLTYQIEKTLNRPITKLYNANDVNVIAAELRLTKTRPTSFNKKHIFCKKQCQRM